MAPQLKRRYRRFRGVISISLILIVVFGLSSLVAHALDVGSVKSMLATLDLSEKRFLVAIVGPLVHRGVRHLFENLVFLLLFGGYIELFTNRKYLLGVSILIGYLSSWTLLLLIDGAGAVGASSVTEGLKMIAGAVALTALFRGLSDLESISGLGRTLLQTFPLVIGFGLGWKAISILSTSSGPTEIIHAFGAFYGLLIAAVYLIQNLPILFERPRETTE